MIPAPALPDSVVLLVWAAAIMAGTALLVAGYRKWQSESAHVVLSSPEYRAERKALIEEVRATISDEAQQTRGILTERILSLGRSIDRVEQNTATKADFVDLRGKIRTLQELNQVLHGVRSSKSGSMERAL